MRQTLDDLKAELEKVGATVKTTGELPWEVTLDGYMFRINENLSIDEISGVGISKKELKLLNGASETLTATVTEGVTGTIKWETSDASVATVENGKVTAVGTSGTATITVKVEGTDYSDTCTVSIVQKVTRLKANDLTVRKKSHSKNRCNNNTKWAGGRFNIYIKHTKYSNSISKMEQ